MSGFEKALPIVLEVEGDYSNDQYDPGGKTRYGITEAEARKHGWTGEMSALPLELAKFIYRNGYWDACKCDEIPWPLNLYVFDSAVNQGYSAAVKVLQQAIGVSADGVLGPVTITRAKQATKWHEARFMGLRAQRYAATANYDKFGAGWMTRLFKIYQG